MPVVGLCSTYSDSTRIFRNPPLAVL